ncbi:DEAD/DEAH box helicase family protein [Theileria parva strain Muguga]|uniref:DEAD box RNA helicase, putative n=1 Tax=Theileria parva TaxID=5875 RepID=Q4MZ24_THEPA|nr:DEAD/DEAH box helicase family protein [Theileria parva strain Muguga]EAN30508.1 DEAD/DEAH box helicase family protein [Theileria parva strain Muguga]|eukprot:XP_762791.1 DEAD box RNA helicase [Theileria parva strain Muguga]
MENSPYGYSSNEVSGDEAILKYDNDLKIVESVQKIEHTADLPYDFSISNTFSDGVSTFTDNLSTATLNEGFSDGLGTNTFGVINSQAVCSILDNNEISPQKRLMLWHSLCSREYLGIFSSLGVSDTVCLIHAESLIVYICCMAHKQGHNLLDFSNGPHTLQFTYRVDRFLKNFMRCGTVKLVFFEVFKKVFDPTHVVGDEEETFFDGYLYYRQLLLCHFKQNNVPFLVFDNWINDAKFQQYLAENEPTCILLEDGSSFVYIFDTVYELLDLPCKGKENLQNQAKYLEYLANQVKIDRYSSVVHTLISQSLSNSLSVAYFFDITRHSEDFKAFISFSSNTHIPTSIHQQSLILTTQLYSLNTTTEENKDNTTENKDNTTGNKDDKVGTENVVEKLYGEVSKVMDRRIHVRDLVVCNYLVEFVKLINRSETYNSVETGTEEEKAQNQLFILTFKCLLVHNYMLENVSLRERCTKRVDVSDWDFYTEDIAATIDFMCYCSYPLFNSLYTMGDSAKLDNFDRTVNDIFDGNLFSTILYLLVQYAQAHEDQVDGSFLNLGQNVVKEFDSVFQHFTGDKAVKFFPIKLNYLTYQLTNPVTTVKSEITQLNHTNANSINGSREDVTTDTTTYGTTDAKTDPTTYGTTDSITDPTTYGTTDSITDPTTYGTTDAKTDVTGSTEYLGDIGSKYLYVNNSFINLYYKFERKDLKWTRAKSVDELVMFSKHFWRDPCSISERMECIDFHINFDLKEKQQDLTKYTRRSIQNQSSFSFLLSKYLGSSNLHHPIVIKLEHFWLHIKYVNLVNYSKLLSIKSTGRELGKSTKHTNHKEKKNVNKKIDRLSKNDRLSKGDRLSKNDRLSKVELMKLKNVEMQENKRLESDNNTLVRLENKLAQLFNNDKSFDDMYTNILDSTDGPNRAVDLLTDFKWVKGVLSTRNVQLLYIYKMIQRLYNCFSSYRLRIVINHPNSFRRLLTILLRLIFIYYQHYSEIMTREIVLLLYTFLYQLNFQSYAKNLVNNFNTQVSRESTDTFNRIKPVDGKKKGSKQNNPEPNLISEKGKSELNLITEREMDRVKKDHEVWDFAIFEGTEYDYMLCYMGDVFERTLGSTNDPRVLFRPDAWQKMLLDIVDAKESALVVAPTSTGKTYICYYAMEQVLRLDDQGMVIYVAPNTALALQVTYEITARFSSKYYTNPNLALSSTFLEKFHDPKWYSSQILVTVPTVLEKLLISMRNSEANFISRLEYVIFDEVHCIADLELGSFLERCIHLIPCPFIALSATIGNATQFHQWLSNITTYNNSPINPQNTVNEGNMVNKGNMGQSNINEGNTVNQGNTVNPQNTVNQGDMGQDLDQLDKKSNKVHFIMFDERFSDLKLEVYFPATYSENSVNRKNRLMAFNPVCCMSYNDLYNNGFPNDVYLTPYDCYLLVQSLILSLSDTSGVNVNTANSEILNSMMYLMPGNYFEGCTLITKRQYRYYLQALKVELTGQIQAGNINSATYDRVLHYVNLLPTTTHSGDLDAKHKLYPLLHNLNNQITQINRVNHVNHIVDKDVEKDVEHGVNEETVESVRERMEERDVFGLLDDMDYLEYLNERSFYEMLKRLQSSRRLPCLVFILDRNKMDHVLTSVTKLLLRLQWEKFFGTPERTLATKMANKARMDKYQMQLRQYESEKKMRASATKEQRELEGITSNMELEVPVEPVDVSQDYDPEFYFYNRKIYINYTDEIDKFINVAANSISNRKNSNLFIEALKRGIGIHHEGLPHKFTILTETLLRLGFLNVIISSKSLAFGINVPCKSVLFCGDNYELTPLMYKQMSGRCGRRGFDLSGHVIFWSIPRKRIKQLLLTRLPTLKTDTNNINLSILLTILSSFYTLIIRSNTQQPLNLQFLNRKGEDYVDVRDDLINSSRRLVIEPKLLVQRLSSIMNNSLNFYCHTQSHTHGDLVNGKLAQDSSVNLDNSFNGVTQGNTSNVENTVVMLIRIMLEILVSCGLVDENGLIRGCYELALLTRDIHPSNILLAKLIQTSKLTQLLHQPEHSTLSHNSEMSNSEMSNSEIIYSDVNNSEIINSEISSTDVSLRMLEILSLLIYRKKEMSNVLNIRRLVSTKLRNGTNEPNVKNTISVAPGTLGGAIGHSYPVAFPDTFPLLPRHQQLQQHINYYNQIVLLITRKYLTSCYSSSKTSEVTQEPQGASTNPVKPVNGKLPQDMVKPGEQTFFSLYHQRNIYNTEHTIGCTNDYMNVNGVVGEIGTFQDLELSLQEFDLTADLVPVIEDNFCKVVQLDSKFNRVKTLNVTFNNSYMCDYFTHGRFAVLRDSNGLGQYAWNYLKKFIVFLQHFKFALKTYTAHLNTDDPLFNHLKHLLDKIEPTFNKI